MSLEPHRVVGSRLLRVRVDRERCQGHARCVAVASALFQLDAFGSAHEVSDGTVPPDPEVEGRLAAADCPELAISIIEESVADLRTRPPVADWAGDFDPLDPARGASRRLAISAAKNARIPATIRLTPRRSPSCGRASPRSSRSGSRRRGSSMTVSSPSIRARARYFAAT